MTCLGPRAERGNWCWTPSALAPRPPAPNPVPLPLLPRERGGFCLLFPHQSQRGSFRAWPGRLTSWPCSQGAGSLRSQDLLTLAVPLILFYEAGWVVARWCGLADPSCRLQVRTRTNPGWKGPAGSVSPAQIRGHAES